MNREWLIIPDCNNLQESLALAEEYNAGFEYNDFFEPGVYSDEEEVKKRISLYKGCSRNPSRDTLHGVFLDMAIASKDPVICTYSRKRMEQSMAIAQELGVKGVVFHSGLIRGLKQETYLEHWYKVQEEWIRYLLNKFPSLFVFMENTFEDTPDNLVELKRRLKEEERFRLCLDYGHAILSPTAPERWFETMAGDIAHIHLNDNDLQADLHMAPGDGEIDFANFKRLLEEYHIECPILLEITGVDKQRRALEYMCKL